MGSLGLPIFLCSCVLSPLGGGDKTTPMGIGVSSIVDMALEGPQTALGSIQPHFCDPSTPDGRSWLLRPFPAIPEAFGHDTKHERHDMRY